MPPSLALFSQRKSLPAVIGLYARDLEKRLKTTTKRRLGSVVPGTVEKIGLIRYVRETATDREPNYKALAAVINAFNKLKDEKFGGTSKPVSEDSLKQLWQSRTDLRSAPHPEVS
jgi:hypothetical protein